jgi:hypothetical protein
MADKPASKTDTAPLMMLAELLFEHPPQVDAAVIEARVRSRLSQTRLVSGKGETLMFAHENHPVTYKGGAQVPAQFVIMTPGTPVDPQRLAPAIQQTWNWDAAEAQAARAKHYLIANELMAQMLDYRERFPLYANSLLGLVEATRPIAVYCHHAQHLLDPAAILRASGAEDPLAMFMCHLNVRLFRIENGAAGDTIMDTRGLAALGLPDVQMHFRGLDPGRVAALLYNYARYLYEHGDCINDGETIDGATPGTRWRCRHEMSLVPPERLVLDIDPGPPHAAGQRG